MKNKCIAELLGTFALVFVGTGAAIVDGRSGHAVTLVGIALAFGLVVMAMIYSIGGVSGAHINPAVTVGLCVARRFPAASVLPYVASQLAGAVLASGLLRLVFYNGYGGLGATEPAPPGEMPQVMQALVMEIILTAFLMFVILCVTTGSKETGALAGLIIGSVVVFDILFGGPVSGASMNPARSFGPAVMSGHFSFLWIYLTAPFLGSIVAVVCWMAIRSPSEDPVAASLKARPNE